MKTRKELKEHSKKLENDAVIFMNEVHTQFTDVLIENLDKYINKQDTINDDEKKKLRLVLMTTISNGILMKSGATKKEIKENYKGLLSDYIKLKIGEKND